MQGCGVPLGILVGGLFGCEGVPFALADVNRHFLLGEVESHLRRPSASAVPSQKPKIHPPSSTSLPHAPSHLITHLSRHTIRIRVSRTLRVHTNLSRLARLLRRALIVLAFHADAPHDLLFISSSVYRGLWAPTYRLPVTE